MDETWWVCESCTSLNRRRARRCYSCGAKMDAHAPAEAHAPFEGVTIVRVAKPDNKPIDTGPAPVNRVQGPEWTFPESLVEDPPATVASAPKPPAPRAPSGVVAAGRAFGRLDRVWALIALAAVLAFWVIAVLPHS